MRFTFETTYPSNGEWFQSIREFPSEAAAIEAALAWVRVMLENGAAVSVRIKQLVVA